MSAPRIPRKSGRFVLRIPPGLHEALDGAARGSGLSLNEYCVRRLATSGAGFVGDRDAAALVARAADLAGDALVAVVVYGSWARGDAAPTSDIDLLVIVEPKLAVTRTLYREWDTEPLSWQGRTVDPHFVHEPAGDVLNGLWGEVATDGIVLFEREWRISAGLARVRRAIAAGRLVRRVVHGQPYWTEAA
ncbi:MAG: toxin-antitoxin system HicB family antitoxin [Ilumatobacter sp.]|nr:toxin-antitoxin system HicB family antitoxin [Ilumatobacter sp.]